MYFETKQISCWKNVQNMQRFNGMFIMAFTFNISSLLRCCRINPLQRKAHKRSQSVACVYGSQDLLYFILLTHMHTHKDTNFCSSSQWGDWLWQCSILFTGRLLHLTFIVAPRAVNFMQTLSKHSVPRAWGFLSQRHHKSIHAKINHFHWTPSMWKEGDEGGGWEDGES